MPYAFEYELCALVFLIVLTARFFEVRRFPNFRNQLFSLILWFAMADLALDIAGSLAIQYITVVPLWLTCLLNTAFYALQVVFPALLMCYVLTLAGVLSRRQQPRWFYWLLLPVIACEILLLLNPFTQHIFLIEAGSHYLHGPAFPLIYIGALFYMLVTLVTTLKYRRQLQQREFITILRLLVIVVATVIVQYFFPSYLMTGVAIVIAILMMSFTLQNPEDMLDLVSGVFNYRSLLDFLSNQLKEHRPLWLIAVDVGGIRRINSAFGVTSGNLALAKVGRFLNGFGKKVWAFRMLSTRFLLVTENKATYQQTLSAIEQRFQEPWRLENEREVMMLSTIRHFGEQNFFQTPQDVVNLIDLAYTEITSEGWGRNQTIDTTLLEKSQRLLDVENAIYEALKNDRGFELSTSHSTIPSGSAT